MTQMILNEKCHKCENLEMYRVWRPESGSGEWLKCTKCGAERDRWEEKNDPKTSC